MKRKIGIGTVYTGFNFGSSLQAYASKVYLSNMGYDVEILSHKEGIINGRDIRIKKIVWMFLRTFWRPKLFKKTFFTYKNSLGKEINAETKEIFLEFYDQKLQPNKCSWKELKEYASQKETLACVCGSDQIWNATNIYIDPIFYLRFAPKHKRVAYAPSFGKNSVPEYNQRVIKKYISDIPYISVREEQGVKIVRELIDRKVSSLIDPTLLLNKEEWLSQIENKILKPKEYILVYFLDKPSEMTLAYIERLQTKSNCPLIIIPYKYQQFEEFKNVEYKNAGPEEFIDLISNAKFVCTDSFHGMIFSANFNIPFYIFQRDYGTATDQSSRIVSILNKLELKSRFISEIKKPKETETVEIDLVMDFSKANQLLEIERRKSREYLQQAFTEINKNEK